MVRSTVVLLGIAIGAAGAAACQGPDVEQGSLDLDPVRTSSALRVQQGSVSGPVSFGTIDLTSIGVGACTGPVSAQIWTLTNSHGLVAKLTDYGATLVELHVPDKAGNFVDIVQGFDTVAGYSASQFAGATVGRVGNRIVDGTFTLDGKTYTVTGAGPVGSNNHALHGGPCGWDKYIWKGEARMTCEGPQITFSLTSPDGDMNFPGTVKAQSVFTLTDDDELHITMTARTDQDTPINMLHHSYFNLGGAGSGTIFNHELQIFADAYTPPAAATGVPDGTIKRVAGTPFDFRAPHLIGLFASEPGVGDQTPPGYDHNWIVRGKPDQLRPVARVKDPASGRVMTIKADQPGVQFYTTNFRPDPNVLPYVPTIGKNGIQYKIHEALALETQKHPNAINFPPNVRPGREDEIIRPGEGETYSHQMIIKFSAE
jgi:aldose 1-epimerase